MIFHRKREWESKESDVTPEAAFWSRRKIMAAAAGVGAAGALGGYAQWGAGPAMALERERSGEPFDPKPATNPDFADAGRAITDEGVNSSYNNFYEFGSHKQIAERAQRLPTADWSLTLGGMVEKEVTLGVEDMLSRFPLEERIIRLRCVEAWAMVAPWIGFPLSDLMALAKPLSGAKYVKFSGFNKPDVAPGQRAFYYPWPYVEGMRIDEAANPLSFMVVGAYGKILPKQFGAPIRVHAPWKYGFKAIKSITRIDFVEERPVSFWEELQGAEYGFWANVNPAVSHPRWSQATERMLGTDERVPTQVFNGYGPYVADMYTGMEAAIGDRLWR